MEGVPQGKLVGPHDAAERGLPGTQHTYWVYVPAQYDAAQAGEPDDLSRRPGVHRSQRRRPRAPNVLEQSDLSPRAAGDDRRVHQSRPHGPISRSRRRDDWGDRNTNRPDRIQLARRPLRPRDLRRAAAGAEQGIQHLERPRAARHRRRELRARSRPSPSPGNGPINSAKC